MSQFYRSILLALAAATLAACATIPGSPENQAAPSALIASSEAEPAATVEPEEIEYGSFTEEQLYQAIISEIGAQRGHLDIAGENYFDLAIETRDLRIIQRAIQFARVNRDMNALLQLGLLWAEVSPDDPQPHLMLSFQFLESGDFDQALSHMARVIDLGGSMDFSTLSARTGRLNAAARIGLISNLRQLSREFADQESIRIALIQLLAQNQEFETALSELQGLQRLAQPTASLVLLQAQLLQSMEREEEALRTLKAGVRKFKQDKPLRLSYARLLIQNREFEDAQRQFETLIEQDSQDWETLFSIALLDLEMENYDSAARIFTRLIGVDQRTDESEYNLGYIYEQQEQLPLAIEHYRQVRIGTNNFLAAQQQATRFSVQLGELEDAHQWLSRLSRGQPRLEILFTTIESSVLIQADHGTLAKALLDTSLNKYPNEADLLFARVLYYDSVSDRQGSESDLKQIISMQPENSRSLNHLGYMLADQTTRFDEALELIERAISISPDDPAIIDSLAWVQYKLGRYEEALQNLRKAFAAFPDHEVASHLGEVLWQMGHEDEATRIWQDALDDRPDSDLIKAVIERFQDSQ